MANLYAPNSIDDDDSDDDDEEYAEVEVASSDDDDFVEEEVLENDNEVEEKRGFFGFGKRKKSFDGGDSETDSETRKDPKKRGLFGSFFGRPDEEEIVFDEAAPSDEDYDESIRQTPSDEDDDALNRTDESMAFGQEDGDAEKDTKPAKKKRRGFFSSFRRSKKDLDEPVEEAEIVVDPEPGEEGDRYLVDDSKEQDAPMEDKEQTPEKRVSFFGAAGGGEPDEGNSPGTAIETDPGDDAAGSAGSQSMDDYVDARRNLDSDDDVEAAQAQRSKAFVEDTDPNPKRRRIILVAGIIFVILATLATAYGGSKLALEKSNSGGSGGGGTTAPTPAPTEPSECLNRQNALIELTMTFDSTPQEVGVSLRDAGIFGTSIWDFPPSSFRSFSQFQRENIFRICLSSVPSYVFGIIDTAKNGLVSRFGEESVFGSWDLRVNREVVASYRSDCNATRNDLRGVSNRTLFSCGLYTNCTYYVRSNGTTGGCMPLGNGGAVDSPTAAPGAANATEAPAETQPPDDATDAPNATGAPQNIRESGGGAVIP